MITYTLVNDYIHLDYSLACNFIVPTWLQFHVTKWFFWHVTAYRYHQISLFLDWFLPKVARTYKIKLCSRIETIASFSNISRNLSCLIDFESVKSAKNISETLLKFFRTNFLDYKCYTVNIYFFLFLLFTHFRHYLLNSAFHTKSCLITMTTYKS